MLAWEVWYIVAVCGASVQEGYTESVPYTLSWGNLNNDRLCFHVGGGPFMSL